MLFYDFFYYFVISNYKIGIQQIAICTFSCLLSNKLLCGFNIFLLVFSGGKLKCLAQSEFIYKMTQNLNKINYFPFRTVSFLFVLYTNSDYATFGGDAGFFCDDETIKQPYFGDTIRAIYLFLVLLGVFGIIVYVSEILYKNHREQHLTSQSQCRLHLKYYYSGFLFVLGVTEILKMSYTKLRPHFFYTCLPDMTNIDCSKGLITQFNCTAGNGWLINRDIYKSFPSGHSALSVYAFIFISIYINSKRSETIPTSVNVWWSRLIPVLCFLWAVACCVTRVSDNRHFWWDVGTGAFIGLIGGLLTVHIALNKAEQKAKSSK